MTRLVTGLSCLLRKINEERRSQVWRSGDSKEKMMSCIWKDKQCSVRCAEKGMSLREVRLWYHTTRLGRQGQRFGEAGLKLQLERGRDSRDLLMLS